MKQDWTDFLLQHGAAQNCLDFGKPGEELTCAQSATVVAPVLDLALIRASGEEAKVFLHNLLTNEVKGLHAGNASLSGFCNAKGRLLATFLIWHDGSDLLLALSADLHGTILKKLSMYVLRSKVKLTDASNERLILGVAGPEAERALSGFGEIPKSPLSISQIAHGQLIRLDQQRFLLSIDAAVVQEVWQKLATVARPVGLDSWRWLDIVAGLPRVTQSTFEEFIPQMVNFDLIGGVSFTKGCYPGQEIVARTRYLGKIKRRMYRAHLEDGIPNSGDHLYAPETEDQSCGRVVNVAPAPGGGHDLLAVIQSSCAEAGEVHLGEASGPRLVLLPLAYEQELRTATSGADANK